MATKQQQQQPTFDPEYWLETIKVLAPELWKDEYKATKTKLWGVLNFSKVYAIGCSLWDDTGVHRDKFIYTSEDFGGDLLMCTEQINTLEWHYNNSPETAIWVYSLNPISKDAHFTDFVVWR